MRAFQYNAHYGLVSLGDGILDMDFEIGKDCAHVVDEVFELGGTMDLLLCFAQSDDYSIRSEQLVYGLLAAFVPYLFKPAQNHSFVVYRHGSSIATSVSIMCARIDAATGS